MKVTNLKLENFRPFRELDISFGERLTVLVGVNGVGKTGILEALAILLSRLIGRIRSTKGTGRFLSDYDILLGSSETVNSIEVSFEDRGFAWTVSKTKRGRKRQKITNLRQVKEIVDRIHMRLEKDDKASVPLAVYYGVNRSVLDIPLRIRMKHLFDQLSAYDEALTGARNDFRLFFEWFRNREDLENELRISGRDNQTLSSDHDYRDPQLEAVREAIEALTGFSDIRIRRSPLRMEVRKGNRRLNVRQLSDGEKCLFAMAGDLARRLAVANPSLERPLEGKGVVLIDEVDLHLHPGWQHRIIPGLLSAFPNCQFVLTTHSPQVLSNVMSRNIRCLIHEEDEIRVVSPDGAYGQDSNFLLRTLLETSYRPVELQEEIDRLYDLIHENDISAARRKIDDLKKKIEGDTPDLIRAETLLHRLEALR